MCPDASPSSTDMLNRMVADGAAPQDPTPPVAGAVFSRNYQRMFQKSHPPWGEGQDEGEILSYSTRVALPVPLGVRPSPSPAGEGILETPSKQAAKCIRPTDRLRVDVSDNRRVFVTGIGVVSPLGLDAETTWAGIWQQGKSGSRLHHRLRHRGLRHSVCCRGQGLRPRELSGPERSPAYGPLRPIRHGGGPGAACRQARLNAGSGKTPTGWG